MRVNIGHKNNFMTLRNKLIAILNLILGNSNNKFNIDCAFMDQHFC